jgi:hypothetical protein
VDQSESFVKSEVRSYHKDDNEGTYFFLIFKDKSGEISATIFNDLISECYDLFTRNSFYRFRGFYVSDANEKYPRTENEYELSFSENPTVQKVPDDDDPTLQFFNDETVPTIADIRKETHNSFVDVIAIIKRIENIDPEGGKDLRVSLCD